MNAFVEFLGTAWAQRVGWALVHFLWQGALIAGLLWLALRLLARRSPQVRYAVAGLALLLMTAAPVATYFLVPVGLPSSAPKRVTTQQLPPPTAKWVNEKTDQVGTLFADVATAEEAQTQPALSQAQLGQLIQDRAAVEQALLDRLGNGSIGAAVLLGEMKCQRALPLLREILLKERYFYGWEGSYDSPGCFLDDSQYARQMACIRAIESIAGKPIAQAVVLTEAERKALEREAADAKVPNHPGGGDIPDPKPWAAKWLLGKLTGNMEKPAIVSATAGREEQAAGTPAWTKVAAWFEPALPYAVSIWLTGVVACSIWHLGGWLKVQRLRRAGIVMAGGEQEGFWLSAAKRLGERFRLRRPVRLLKVAHLAGPVVAGVLRPAVLIPAAVVTGLTPPQIEAILAHELAHVRRHDYLVNLLQTLVETLLFYHPAVWWVSARIRIEREHCCDDLAVAAVGDGRTYAAALAALAEIAAANQSVTGERILTRLAPAKRVAPGASMSLLSRIRRVMGIPESSSSRWTGALAGLVVLTGIMFAIAIYGCKSHSSVPPAITDEETWFRGYWGHIHEQLSDRDPNIRARAAEKLGQSATDQGAVDALKIALNDPVPAVRYSAAISLAKLGYVNDRVAVALAECFVNSQATGMYSGPNALQIAGVFNRADIASKAKAGVPLLINAAGPGRSSEWRCTSLEILGKIGSPRAVPVLREALHDGDNNLRCTAARALAEIGPAAKDAAPDLKNLLGNGDFCAKLAGETLAKIGAVDVLIDEVKKRDTNRLEPAVLGLAFATDHLEEAAKVLTAEVDRGNDEAAQSLIALGDVARGALPEFLKLARSQGEIAWAGHAVAAAQFAVKFNVTDQFLPIFIEQLASEKPCESENAAVALGEMGPAAAPATKALIQVLQSPTGGSRRSIAIEQAKVNAAKALGMIKSDDPDVIPALIATLASHNQLLLDNSIWSLGEYGPAAKDAVPRLVEKQLDHDNALARTTLRALAKIGPAAKEAVPALIQDTRARYYDDDVWVALAAIGPDAAAAVPTLFEHVVKNRSGDRAMKTIAAIGPGAIPFLTGKLHGTPQEQALAIQCLARMDSLDESLLPTLVGLLGHKDPLIRNFASQSLGKMGASAAEAVGPLRKLLTEPNPWVQFEAATALRKIAQATRAQATMQLIALVARSLPGEWQFAGQEQGILAPACWVQGDGLHLAWRHKQINPRGDWKRTSAAGVVHLWIMDAGYPPKEEMYAQDGRFRRASIAAAEEIAVWRGRRVFLWGRGDDWPSMKTDLRAALKATDTGAKIPLATAPAAVEREVAGSWGTPNAQGLQTRLVIGPAKFVRWEILLVRIEIRQKDGKEVAVRTNPMRHYSGRLRGGGTTILGMVPFWNEPVAINFNGHLPKDTVRALLGLTVTIPAPLPGAPYAGYGENFQTYELEFEPAPPSPEWHIHSMLEIPACSVAFGPQASPATAPATGPAANPVAIVAGTFERIHKRVGDLKGQYPVLDGIENAHARVTDSGTTVEWAFANNATEWGKADTPSAVDPGKPFCRIILNMWTRSDSAGDAQPVATQQTYRIGGMAWEGFLKVWSNDTALVKAVTSIVDEELARATHPAPAVTQPATAPATQGTVPIPEEAPPEVRKAIGDLYSPKLETRAYAAVRLGEMGETALPAIPHLLRVIRDGSAVRLEVGGGIKDTSIGTEAEAAIVKMGDKGAAALAAMLADANANRRAEAAWALYGIRHPALLEHLPALLRDEDPGVRECAAAAVGKYKDFKSVGPLIELVKTEKEFRVLETAALSLGQLKSQDALDPLVDALRRELPAYPSSWVPWALRQLNDPDKKALAVLLEAVKSADIRTRCNAVEAVGWLGDRSAVSAALGALGDGNARVRCAAASACGRLGDKSAAGALVKAMKDGDVTVRERAVGALGALCSPDSMESIVAMTKDPQAPVRTAAIAAIRTHWANLDPQGSALGSGLQVSPGREKERKAYLNRMLQCGAVHAMVEALNDPGADVRHYAAQGLLELSRQNLGESYAKWMEWYDNARTAMPTTQPAAIKVNMPISIRFDLPFGATQPAPRKVPILSSIELVDKDDLPSGLYCRVPSYARATSSGGRLTPSAQWVYKHTIDQNKLAAPGMLMQAELSARLDNVYTARGTLEVADQVVQGNTITIRLRYISEDKDIARTAFKPGDVGYDESGRQVEVGAEINWPSIMVSGKTAFKSVYLWGHMPSDLSPGQYTVSLELDQYVRKGGKLEPAPSTTINHFERLSSTYTVSDTQPATRPATAPASQPTTKPARQHLFGIVTDAKSGKPVAGAKVGYVIPSSPNRGLPDKIDYELGTVTDAEGRFELTKLPMYGFVVSHERYWSRRIEFGSISSLAVKTDRPGEVLIKVSLSAGPGIIGVVSDADGKPVPRAAVSSGEKAATTDAQGRFVIFSPRVYDGNAYVSVGMKGFIPLESKVRPGDTPVSLILERPYELLVRAQTPQGRDVNAFEVHVELPQTYPAYARIDAEAYQLEAGLARVTFYTPGKRTLWIVAKGYAMAETPVEIVRNMGPVTAKLSAGVSVTGKASIADGEYASGKVILRPSNRWIVPSTSVPLNEDGSYRIEHVGGGQYDLTIQVPGKTDAKTSIKVANADIEVPELKVRGTGTVVGQVFYYQGDAPWPNVHGSIFCEDRKQLEFQTDKDGRFRVEGVTLGKARVSAGAMSGCSYNTVEAEVDVQENKTHEVKLAPKAATQPAATRPTASR